MCFKICTHSLISFILRRKQTEDIFASALTGTREDTVSTTRVMASNHVVILNAFHLFRHHPSPTLVNANPNQVLKKKSVSLI